MITTITHKDNITNSWHRRLALHAGGVCEEIDTLGNEKEAVCIVSGEGVYVGRSTRLGYEKEAVCIVSWEGAYVGRSTRLGYEKETVCIVSWQGAYVRRSTRLGMRKRLYVL